MQDSHNYLATNEDSVFELMKLLAKKQIHNSKIKSGKLEKKLFHLGYEILLGNSYSSLDFKEADFLEMLMQSSQWFINEDPARTTKFISLLETLEHLSQNLYHLFNVLKFLISLRVQLQDASVEKCTMSGCNTISRIESDEKKLKVTNLPRSRYLRKTWEMYGVPGPSKKEPMIYGVDINLRLIEHNKLIKPTHVSSLKYVPRADLRCDVISALIGLPSSSFMKVDQSMEIVKGLYTDGVGPETLAGVMIIVMKSGSSYLKLKMQQVEDKISICNLGIMSYLQHFLELYYVMVLNFPKVTSIGLWLKYLNPLSQQIEFLTSLLSPLLKPSKFLEKLYFSFMKDFSNANLSIIAHTLLFDCCRAYFNKLDSWIFEGTWHNDLFIHKFGDLQNVCSRESWLTAFIFIKQDAPNFLPCLDIYQCGRNVAFLKLCSGTDPFVHSILLEERRPRIRLCTSITDLNELREECNEFTCYVTNKLLVNKHNAEESYFGENSVSCENNIQEEKPLTGSQFSSNRKIMIIESQDNIGAKAKEANDLNKEENVDEAAMHAYPSDINSLIEIKKRREELADRYECLISENEKRRRYLLWKQSRTTHDDFRERLLSQLYIPTYKGEVFHLPSPSKIPYNCNVMVKRKSDCITGGKDSSNDSILVDIVKTPSAIVNKSNCDVTENNNESNRIMNKSSYDAHQVPNVDDSNTVCLESPGHCVVSFDDNVSLQSIETSLSEQSSSKGSNDLECDYNEELENIQLSLKSKDIFRINNIVVNRIRRDCKISKNPILAFGENDAGIFPVKEMITNSIIIPLKMQKKLVNDALIRVFMVENKFLCRAQALTNMFLLMDGLFASRLIDALCNALQTESPYHFLTCNRLTRVLDDATGYSDNNLSFKINSIPQFFVLNDPQVLSCISLTYKVEWPLNFLITPTMISKYDSVFAFLVSLERTFWTLKHLFIDLKMNSIDVHQYRAIHLHRYFMTQFICSLKSYIQYGINEKWNKFCKDVDGIEDIESLYRIHVNFVKEIRYMCFLGSAGVKLFEEITRIIQVILKYCRTVSIGEWSLNDTETLTHSKFGRLQHHFESFMSLARFISAFIEKLVEHRYRAELDILLQILTLNSFYHS